jgi:bile acid:Na+ symporter, BASS family
MIHLLTRLFPLWAVMFSLLAYFFPAHFIAFKSDIVPLLALVMFGMGLGLSLQDFRRALAMPRLILLGLFLQFSIMPLAALFIVQTFGLDPALGTGMILLGACPGGTASNVICYLVRGNVALSITLTALSTLLAVVLTPLITLWLADSSVDVPAGPMLLSILYIVLAPVAAGLLLNHFFQRRLARLQTLFPLLSVIAIVLIIAVIVALNASQLATLGLVMMAAVMLHNAIGLAGGYYASRLLGYAEREARTIAIEVGMQNSGLAVALAFKYFTPAAALPGAIFSVWHNLSGSALVAFWNRK